MILEKFNLADKSGLVTGAGSGIGKAMASGLVEAGAEVVIAGRKMDRLESAAREMNSAGTGRAVPVQADVSAVDGIKALFDRVVDEFGKVDFLFNNAGTIFRSPTEDFPVEEWNRVLAVNLTAPFVLPRWRPGT